jgi:ABC-type multidrug transport system fused ATPase/permease subunit
VSNELNRASWIGTGLQALGWAIFAVAYLIAVLIVIQRATRGEATASDVILSIAVAAPISFVGGVANRFLSLLQNVVSQAQRYLWLQDMATEARGSHLDPAPVPVRLESGIHLEKVGFRYPGVEQNVLSDVTLEFPAGSVVALVGENGAGKTTLVKLLCRLYDPSEGRVTIDGVDLTRLPVNEWRARICAGFQDFVQFEVLARETIGLGDLPRIADLVAVGTAIDRAGASDVTDSLPAGLETQLGKEWDGGVELSSGQWQKLALSRALMRDVPLLVVLDEPTAALDASAEHALFEHFAAAARAGRETNHVTLLVSHRFSTVRMADLIVVLDRGRVVESGSHAELIQARGLYAELYEMQAGSYR